jgi:hypothetical protein
LIKTRKKLKMGVGIIKDHERKVLATKCSSKLHIINPTVMKAFATYIVEEFDKNLRIQNIILEGDAVKIGNALQKEGQS